MGQGTKDPGDLAFQGLARGLLVAIFAHIKRTDCGPATHMGLAGRALDYVTGDSTELHEIIVQEKPEIANALTGGLAATFRSALAAALSGYY